MRRLAPTFGGDAIVRTDFGRSGDEFRAVDTLQPNGKIVVGCSDFTGGGSRGRFAVARYDSNGTLDATFGGDGKVRTDFTGFDDCAADVAISPTGDIVVAGVSGIGGRHAGFAVARYLAS